VVGSTVVVGAGGVELVLTVVVTTGGGVVDELGVLDVVSLLGGVDSDVELGGVDEEEDEDDEGGGVTHASTLRFDSKDQPFSALGSSHALTVTVNECLTSPGASNFFWKFSLKSPSWRTVEPSVILMVFALEPL
jgi:hypothetical protein